MIDTNMDYIQKVGDAGYKLKLSNHLAKYFSKARYGSMEDALTAARLCRDYYFETGQFRVPPPPIVEPA